jgi:hypothetical protein
MIWTAILKLFGGNNMLATIVTIVSLAVAAWGALKVHDWKVRREALRDFNAQQQKIIDEQNAKFEQQIKKIVETQNILIKELKEKNIQVEKQIVVIERQASKAKGAKPTAEVDPYLKEIVKQIEKGIK